MKLGEKSKTIISISIIVTFFAAITGNNMIPVLKEILTWIFAIAVSVIVAAATFYLIFTVVSKIPDSSSDYDD